MTFDLLVFPPAFGPLGSTARASHCFARVGVVKDYAAAAAAYSKSDKNYRHQIQ